MLIVGLLIDCGWNSCCGLSQGVLGLQVGFQVCISGSCGDAVLVCTLKWR